MVCINVCFDPSGDCAESGKVSANWMFDCGNIASLRMWYFADGTPGLSAAGYETLLREIGNVGSNNRVNSANRGVGANDFSSMCAGGYQAFKNYFHTLMKELVFGRRLFVLVTYTA